MNHDEPRKCLKIRGGSNRPSAITSMLELLGEGGLGQRLKYIAN